MYFKYIFKCYSNQNLTHSWANKEEIQTKIYAQSIMSARNKVKYK